MQYSGSSRAESHGKAQEARQNQKPSTDHRGDGVHGDGQKGDPFRKVPNIDFVLGTNNISDLGEVIDEVLNNKQKTIRAQDQFEENLDYLVAKRDDKVKAFVSIIRGCE